VLPAAAPAADRDPPKWFKPADQGDADPRLKGYVTPEGVKVEVVAEHPTVTNPVALTFGDDGTLYVVEWRSPPGDEVRETPETFTFRDGTRRTVPTLTKKNRDVVKVLADGKGAGVYDQAKVVLEEDLPSGILVHDGWLYLAGRGTVRRYRTADLGAWPPEKGKEPKAEVIARGFAGYGRRQVSGLTVGPDGWLYVSAGEDNVVEGSDGSRVAVPHGGAVFRCRPDGAKVHVHSTGYANPYGPGAFDAQGNLFLADADPGGRRLLHGAEGADQRRRSAPDGRGSKPDADGLSAGVLVYDDTRFPEAFRGLVLCPDAANRSVRAYRVEPQGATFSMTEEFDLLNSNDPLFRPSQAVLGPDGAVYVSDWRSDPARTGRLGGDGEHGRIYRLSWAGTKEEPALPRRGMDSWARFGKLSDEELLKSLAGDDLSDRLHAQRELARRGGKERAALLELLFDVDRPAPARVAALGGLQSMWNEEVRDAFLKVLDGKDADLRRLAADGLGQNAERGDREAHHGLLRALGDPSPAARRAVFLAMGRVAGPGAEENLANALSFDDGKDGALRAGLVRGVERLGKPGVDALIALAESGKDADTDKVGLTFTDLRTPVAAEGLLTLLRNPHLTAKQRATMLRSLGDYQLDSPLPLDGVYKYLREVPADEVAVRAAGLEVVGPAPVLRTEPGLAWLEGQLDDKDAEVRLAAVRAVAAGRLAKLAPRLAKMLADFESPAKERAAELEALRVLDDRTVVPLLKEILKRAPGNAVAEALVQGEALWTLAALDPAAAFDVAGTLVRQPDAPLAEDAVRVLGTQPDGAKLAGRLFLDRKLPASVRRSVADALRRHAGSDAEAARLLDAVLDSGSKK
jgi:glucose/arabinose dehydrogenase